MNTVINQLVKEAAYHAAKYDSTINAIRSIAQSSQMTKTAFVDPDVLSNLWGGMSPADAIESALRGDTGSTIGELANIIKSNIGDNLGMLGEAVSSPSAATAGLGGLAGLAGGGALAADAMTAAGNAMMSQQAAKSQQAINALKSQLGAAGAQNAKLTSQLGEAAAQNADLFANAGARFQNAGNDALAKLKGLGGSIADMGAAAKNKLMGLGGGIVNAAKAHPYAAAGLGLAGAGAAALPFLLGGEKEGSYDPYKLQVLRSVLSGM